LFSRDWYAVGRPDNLSGHTLRDVPVGIPATGVRRDAYGTGTPGGARAGSTTVRADRYWGALTQLSLRAGLPAADPLPDRFHRCYGIAKKAAAAANGQAGRLPAWKLEAVAMAADDLIAGRLSDHFPLSPWQSGSGRETDTNVNEVLANRAIQLLGGTIGSGVPIDPARDVNLGQSLTGMFTTSLHIATVMELEEALVPSAAALARALDRAAMSSLAGRLRAALARIDEAEGGLHEIVSGGTHDGPDMSEPDWRAMAAAIAQETGRPFVPPPEGDADPGSLDAIVAAMSAVRGLAVSLLDIAEPQVRTQVGGTRGRASGGVRPDRISRDRTSLEAMSMVCTYVIGLDQVVASAGSRGNRAPRVQRPLIVVSVLNALRTLGQACASVRAIIAPSGRR
jgi:fumarate hydratase class II